MVGQVDDIYTQKWGNALGFLSQQTDQRIAGSVDYETGAGKTHWVDAIGSGAAQQIVGRYQDTPNNDIDHQRTRVNLAGYNFGKMLDSIDELQTIHDPKGKYAMAAAAAMVRAKDSVVISAFFADALRGEAGGTTVSFPAANQVAVNSWAYGAGSGNTGLTISKLIEAKQKLMAGEVDPDEEIFCAVSSKQAANLLATTEFTSADYNTVKTLASGNFKNIQFMGFTFVHSERLSTDSNSYRRVPVWQKSGMHLAVGKDIKAQVSQRADKNYNWQVYYEMYLGAARKEDAKVIEIKCTE